MDDIIKRRYVIDPAIKVDKSTIIGIVWIPIYDGGYIHFTAKEFTWYERNVYKLKEILHGD